MTMRFSKILPKGGSNSYSEEFRTHKGRVFFECCDCGLVHEHRLRSDGRGEVLIKLRPRKDLTLETRRRRKRKKRKEKT